IVSAGPSGVTFANSTVGTVPITLANVQRLKFSGAGGGGNDVVNVTGGAYELDADTAVGSPNVTVSVGAGATVAFASDQHLAGLTINGGTVATAASGNAQIAAGSLSITGGGKLDLGMGSLLLDSASVSAGAIRQY